MDAPGKNKLFISYASMLSILILSMLNILILR